MNIFKISDAKVSVQVAKIEIVPQADVSIASVSYFNNIHQWVQYEVSEEVAHADMSRIKSMAFILSTGEALLVTLYDDEPGFIRLGAPSAAGMQDFKKFEDVETYPKKFEKKFAAQIVKDVTTGVLEAYTFLKAQQIKKLQEKYGYLIVK